MNLDYPLSNDVKVEVLDFKHFSSHIDTASSIVKALEVLENKLSDDEFVEANALEISAALTSIVYKFGGCLIDYKYPQTVIQHTWETSSILSTQTYGDMMITTGKIVKPSSYTQLIDDLDTRLGNIPLPGVIDDVAAADFVNATIEKFSSKRR